MISRLTIVCCVTFNFILFAVSIPCIAVIHGDTELLKIVAERNQENFDSVLTWKSNVVEKNILSERDRINIKTEYNCEIVYDRINNSIRWNKKTVECSGVVNGKPYRDPNYGYYSQMVKNNKEYSYSVQGTREGKPERYLVIKEKNNKPNITNLDPRGLIHGPMGGGTVYDRLMFLFNNATNPKLSECYISQENNLIILRMPFKYNDEDRMEKYVFNLSTGGNVVEYSSKGSKDGIEINCEYEEKSGVWVLKSYKRISFNEKGNSSRAIIWENSTVNIPFKEDEFTFQKLGMKSGDTIFDGRIGIQYTLDANDGNYNLPVELENISASEEENKPIDMTKNKDNKNAQDNISFSKELESDKYENAERNILKYGAIFSIIIIFSVVGYMKFAKPIKKKRGATGD